MSKREFTPEEIVESLRVCGECGDGRCDKCAAAGQGLSACLAIFTGAAELIEAQAKRIGELEEQLRWIPVTERMPKLREPVLVSLDDCVQEAFLLSNGEWCCRSTVERFEVVTHWRPMPKGPEER